ncbi:hypothetical protein D3C73_364830 [compost metagenome]
MYRTGDEEIFNVAPVLEGRGLNLLIDGGVVQLRYAIDRTIFLNNLKKTELSSAKMQFLSAAFAPNQ